jgi:hypothetical protein
VTIARDERSPQCARQALFRAPKRNRARRWCR